MGVNSVLRNINKRITEIDQKLNPQRVAVKLIKPSESFNPENYGKQNKFRETDVLLTISLDKD